MPLDELLIQGGGKTSPFPRGQRVLKCAQVIAVR